MHGLGKVKLLIVMLRILLILLFSKRGNPMKVQRTYAKIWVDGVLETVAQLKIVVSFYIWLVFFSTIILFESCVNKKEDNLKTGNSKFLSYVGSDSLSTEFIFSNKNSVKLILETDQVKSKIKLSNIMTDYRMLHLNNFSGSVLGDIDKILLLDSLVFILDQYTHNSLQIFNFFTGNQVGLLYPTGEGPGEMKSISEFDLDKVNRRILIYDNLLAKVLYFTFGGEFLFEKRLPIRAHSFKIFPENQLLFSSIGDVNDHLGDTGKSDLFLLDSNLMIKNTFRYPKINQSLSDYIPRDIIRENNGMVTYFPRFSNELFQVDLKNNRLNSLIEINLGATGLSKQDLNSIGSDFVIDRKKDNKLFGFGLHFVTQNWIGMNFNRFGGPEFHLYYNRKNGEVISGTELEFDFEDLIFYSFPLVCENETCVSFIRLGKKQYSDYDNFIKKFEGPNRNFDKIKNFLKTIEDFEQPILLVFSLK